MSKIEEGKAAPAFSLPATNGKKVTLKDFKGKKNVVLYFYPKDMTPGCTTEACDFKKSHKKFVDLKTEILGVSTDPLARHDKFIEKFKLPFTLLSDEDHKVAQSYGVWAKKKLYGREFMGLVRSTFLIDKKGKIVKAWPKVRVKDHVKDVLDAVKNIKHP